MTTLNQVRVAPGVGIYDAISERLFQPILPGPAGSLACAVAYMLSCWMLGWLLDRRGIVVKL